MDPIFFLFLFTEKDTKEKQEKLRPNKHLDDVSNTECCLPSKDMFDILNDNSKLMSVVSTTNLTNSFKRVRLKLNVLSSHIHSIFN